MKRALVYGAKGALGRAVVQHFKAQQYWVACVDMESCGPEADASVVLSRDMDVEAQAAKVCGDLKAALQEDTLDAVITVAGGWAGGNAAAKEFIPNAELMWKQSVWSSLAAAQVCASLLKKGGLLVLTGAVPALKGTPGMMGYGMAKAAVHQLTASLAAPNSGLPDGAAAVAILPITLDTPMNRKFMPKADHSKWTPLEVVAAELERWTCGEGRPASGSLVKLLTDAGNTKFEPVTL